MFEIRYVLEMTAGAVSVLCIFLIAGHMIRRKRKREQIRHPPGFLRELSLAYESCGNIRQMLLLAAKRYEEDPISDAVRTAAVYLERSRYRDYETALAALSDGSEEYQSFCQELMRKEEARKHRLTVKDVPDSGTEDNREKSVPDSGTDDNRKESVPDSGTEDNRKKSVPDSGTGQRERSQKL